MIQQISALSSSALNALLPTKKQTPPQLPTQRNTELRPQDSLKVTAPKGFLPVSIGLFAHSAIDNALNDLSASPTQAHFRQAQANFRVLIRDLSDGDLQLAEQSLKQTMNGISDYRTQVFMDEISFDIQFEKLDRTLSKSSVQGQPLEASSPQALVSAALKQLAQSPTEANFRQAKANFNVSIRSLSVDGLKSAMAALDKAMTQTNDYRTQVFLGKIKLDATVERAWKDKSYQTPLPQMPEPLVGNTGTQLASSALERLAQSPTEAHFKTSRAAFRVAIRNLDLNGLNQSEAHLKSVMGQTSDYRTQVFLDLLMLDIHMAKFDLK